MLYGLFMAISKGFIYLDKSRKIAIKVLVNTFKFRCFVLEDKLSVRSLQLIDKIKSSNRFYNKNIHSNKSLVNKFANFLAKDDSSSDEEYIKIE